MQDVGKSFKETCKIQKFISEANSKWVLFSIKATLLIHCFDGKVPNADCVSSKSES